MARAANRVEDIRRRLLLVQQHRLLARWNTPYDKFTSEGWVVGVGAAFVALLLIRDDQCYDGVACFRLQDVQRLRPAPHPQFVRTVLRLRGQRRPRLRLRLDDAGSALRSIARAFPLVTIHRERLHPDECNIGKLAEVDAGTFGLQEINPGAKWERRVTTYRLRDVTRIEGGGGYEAALWLVGGEAPPLR
jgi:hypothetical protein